MWASDKIFKAALHHLTLDLLRINLATKKEKENVEKAEKLVKDAREREEKNRNTPIKYTILQLRSKQRHECRQIAKHLQLESQYPEQTEKFAQRIKACMHRLDKIVTQLKEKVCFFRNGLYVE
ncbi:hypothetical protein BDB00DRAFT_306611 [Zychaea mexicana]|uniref:uncharacterized protein n=1 Tax=Zychaea mexicana TaxID=64656 RepID=UPI0022FE9E86|nr:uncharacterized protein BDB00DRAFT_306611 [Zychaea mexicana]KAI9494503.1 hypothetical protein BDB00DRAFT_306611 [Zychaea mexicana]